MMWSSMWFRIKTKSFQDKLYRPISISIKVIRCYKIQFRREKRATMISLSKRLRKLILWLIRRKRKSIELLSMIKMESFRKTGRLLMMLLWILIIRTMCLRIVYWFPEQILTTMVYKKEWMISLILTLIIQAKEQLSREVQLIESIADWMKSSRCSRVRNNHSSRINQNKINQLTRVCNLYLMIFLIKIHWAYSSKSIKSF